MFIHLRSLPPRLMGSKLLSIFLCVAMMDGNLHRNWNSPVELIK